MDSRKLILVAFLVPMAVGVISGYRAKPPEQLTQWQTLTTIVPNTVTVHVTQTITDGTRTMPTVNALVAQPAEKLALARLYPCQYPEGSSYFAIYCETTEWGILQTYQWVADKQGNLYLRFTLRNEGPVPVTIISIDIVEHTGAVEQSGQGGQSPTDMNSLPPGHAVEYSFPNNICNIDFELLVKCPSNPDWRLNVFCERGTVLAFEIGPIPANVPIVP